MEDEKPKRRKRYKGKHPRRYEEKYKEQNATQYPDDAKKILLRGATLAGTHRPICVEEILKVLKPEAGMTAIDATLGFGGHAVELIPKLVPKGIFIGVDQDPIERPKTETKLRKYQDIQIEIAPINFRYIKSYLNENNLGKAHIVLADLGVSSMQIDDPQRGFSFKVQSDFDLRMNPREGVPAWQFLRQIKSEDLRKILLENSDEPHARQIAEALKKSQPRTTTEVAEAVRGAMAKLSPNIQKKEGDLPIRRVFQALRIAVNDELAALDDFLRDLPEILATNGRVAILSFHSGEDRRVKKAFQLGLRTKIYSEISKEFIRPSYEEQQSNPRSKPAKLRWAVRN